MSGVTLAARRPDGRASGVAMIVAHAVARRRPARGRASCSACCSSPPAAGACGWNAAGEARAPQDAAVAARDAQGAAARARLAGAVRDRPGLHRRVDLLRARPRRRARARPHVGSSSSPAACSSRWSCPPTSRAPRCTRSAAARRSSPATRSTSWSSFIAGWAILLDYLILIALCAFATTDYLGGVLARRFGDGVAGVPARAPRSCVYVALAEHPRRRLAALRARRARSCSATSSLQLLIVVLGLALLFEPDVLTDPARDRRRRRRSRTWCSRSRSSLVAFSGHRRLLGPGRPGRDRPRAGCRRLIGVRAAGGARPVRRHRAGRAPRAAAARSRAGRLGRGADARRRRRLRPGRGCASRCATWSAISAFADPRHRLQRGDARALAARLLARDQPPDPVARSAACTRRARRRW